MRMRLRLSGCTNRGAERRSRRLKSGSVLVLLSVMAALVAVIGAGSAAADGVKPTLTKSVDANGDAVFSDTENVPKTVSYPWTVTYQLTVSAGSFNHTITTITDSTTSNIGGC